MKTKQNKQLRELTDEELKQVNGGVGTILAVLDLCSNPTLCAAQGKQLDTKTCKCY